jgi:hypothetical protein
MECYACGKEGHPAASCEDWERLIRNRWVHLNQRGRLAWGTIENPQGEVRNIQGTFIVRTVVEGIQEQLKKEGHTVVDPLSTVNPHEAGS